MRLELPDIDRERRARFDEEVGQLTDCVQLHAPVCRPDCPEAKRRPCTASCPHAPLALTCDGDFPIEPGILPLVFELKASRAFEPVWSCEGHLDPSGGIFRLPSVWFCCECVSHVRILADVVAQLAFECRLAGNWRVTLCCPGHQTPNTVFALEPDGGSAATLDQLHRDISKIADGLRQSLAGHARDTLARS